ERVGALEPGVVRHLVVAGEGRVDGRSAAHHVRQDAVDDQVAHDHAHRRPEHGVDPPSMAPGLHVAPGGPQRRRDLEKDLPAKEPERARDVEAVGEEGAVAGVRALLLAYAADGENDLLRLAGEQVAAARPSVDEQADAGGVLALDLLAVLRARAGDYPARLLVHPAEGRNVLVRAEQDSRLAGARLRGEGGLPLRDALRA